MPGLIPHPIPDVALSSISILKEKNPKNLFSFPLSSTAGREAPSPRLNFLSITGQERLGGAIMETFATLTPCYFFFFFFPKQVLKHMGGLAGAVRAALAFSGRNVKKAITAIERAV